MGAEKILKANSWSVTYDTLQFGDGDFYAGLHMSSHSELQ